MTAQNTSAPLTAEPSYVSPRAGIVVVTCIGGGGNGGAGGGSGFIGSSGGSGGSSDGSATGTFVGGGRGSGGGADGGPGVVTLTEIGLGESQPDAYIQGYNQWGSSRRLVDPHIPLTAESPWATLTPSEPDAPIPFPAGAAAGSRFRVGPDAAETPIPVEKMEELLREHDVTLAAVPNTTEVWGIPDDTSAWGLVTAVGMLMGVTPAVYLRHFYGSDSRWYPLADWFELVTKNGLCRIQPDVPSRSAAVEELAHPAARRNLVLRRPGAVQP